MTDARITLKEVYGALVELRQDVNVMHAEVSVGLNEIQELKLMKTDHEVRLRSVERWRWGFAGALAFVVTTAGVLGAIYGVL